MVTRGTGAGGPLRRAVVLPGGLFHCLRYETPAAEECNCGTVFSPQDQHLRVQVCVVSGEEVHEHIPQNELSMVIDLGLRSRSTATIIFSAAPVVRTTSSAPAFTTSPRRSRLQLLMSATTGSPFSCLSSLVPSQSGRSRSTITQAGFWFASSKIPFASASDLA